MDSPLQLLKRVWLLVRRANFSRGIDDEIAFHLEETEKQLQADGMVAEEARYAARRQFGNATRLKEEAVDTVGFTLESALQDLRYAIRQLQKNPGFTATSVLILALGLGATTAIFSAVNPVLFEPLPYPHAQRVTMVSEKRIDSTAALINFADYHGLAERSRSFEWLAALKPWQPTMTGPDEPERFEGQRVSAPYFRVLGVLPTLGRGFQPGEDVVRGPNVVILSDKLWRRRFGADASIIGRAIRLDDDLFTVIGVMPRAFDNVLAPEAELWAPLQYDSTLPPWTNVWGHHLQMIGRLRPGVNTQKATAELDVIARDLARVYASGYAEAGGPPNGFIVHALQGDVTQGVRPALLAVLGAVILVLVIACVNVANLLLARGAQRRGELAMRAALGASGLRLIRQLLTESLVLAGVGGALGIIVAEFGVGALKALSPPGLPRLNAIGVDGVAFAFAVAIATAVGLLVGLVPALHASRSDPREGLQQMSRRTAGTHPWTRRMLVVAEVALALVLLVSAGLLVRTLQHLFSINAGFDGSHVLTMQVQESGHRYDSDDARLRFFEQALDRVRQVPGVVSAGFTSQLPLSGQGDVYGMRFENDNNPEGEGAFRYAVTPGYVEAMRIPLRRGRLFNRNDMQPGAPRVVLINESFARSNLPGQDPIGHRVCPRCLGNDQRWATIVGVVGDVRQLSLELSDADALYLPSTQWYWADNVMWLAVRARGDAAALAPAIRNAIWSVDKDQPIVRVATMDHLVADSQAQRRFAMVIFEVFAGVALILAATGLFGVLAGSVTERTREIGVRAALGATRADILAMVLRQGVGLAAIGVVIGLTGAVIATPVIATLLFGVSRLDPLTYAGVIALLAGVCALACWVPARRAASIDAAITLRAE